MMKRCSKCDSFIQESEKFCPLCHEPVEVKDADKRVFDVDPSSVAEETPRTAPIYSPQDAAAETSL